jgi:hypothetical protein
MEEFRKVSPSNSTKMRISLEAALEAALEAVLEAALEAQFEAVLEAVLDDDVLLQCSDVHPKPSQGWP